MKTIVLDPGHGGHDPGAVGPNGTKESERALDVCLRAEKLLLPFVKVLLTRRTDIFLSLTTRPAEANAANADAFVSYHFNSGSDPRTALSFEGFTTPGQNNSDRLATQILVAHGRLCPWQKLRADTSDGDPDKEANFAVIRGTRCPSMLMEGEFIHTIHGEASILNPEHQQLRALAVAIGVLNFFSIQHTLGAEKPRPDTPPDLTTETILRSLESIERETMSIRQTLP